MTSKKKLAIKQIKMLNEWKNEKGMNNYPVTSKSTNLQFFVEFYIGKC